MAYFGRAELGTFQDLLASQLCTGRPGIIIAVTSGKKVGKPPVSVPMTE